MDKKCVEIIILYMGKNSIFLIYKWKMSAGAKI